VAQKHPPHRTPLFASLLHTAHGTLYKLQSVAVAPTKAKSLKYHAVYSLHASPFSFPSGSPCFALFYFRSSTSSGELVTAVQSRVCPFTVVTGPSLCENALTSSRIEGFWTLKDAIPASYWTLKILYVFCTWKSTVRYYRKQLTLLSHHLACPIYRPPSP
jgi:hypothetical protein